MAPSSNAERVHGECSGRAAPTCRRRGRRAPNTSMTSSAAGAGTSARLRHAPGAAGRHPSIRPYSRSVDGPQYIATRGGGSAATFGQRLHLLVHRAEHAVGAVPAQLRGDTELYARGLRGSRSRRAGGSTDFGEPCRAAPACCGCTARAGRARRSRRCDWSVSVVRDGNDTFTLPPLDLTRLSFRRTSWRAGSGCQGSTAFLIWQQSRQTSASRTS